MAYNEPTPQQLIASWESAISRLEKIYATANKSQRLRLTAQMKHYRKAIENTKLLNGDNK